MAKLFANFRSTVGNGLVKSINSLHFDHLDLKFTGLTMSESVNDFVNTFIPMITLHQIVIDAFVQSFNFRYNHEADHFVDSVQSDHRNAPLQKRKRKKNKLSVYFNHF